MKLFVPNKITSLIALTALIFSGCSPLIWPSAYQVPAVEKQGDLALDALTVTTALTAQAAYSPANHLVLTGAYNNSLIDKDKGHDYNYTGFGIGYYTGTESIQAGVLGRYGFGYSQDKTINSSNELMFTQVDYHHYQLQPYVRFFPANQNHEYYLGFRNSAVQIDSFSGNDDSRMSPGNHITFEPFAGWRFGTKNLKLDVQLGLYTHKRSYAGESGRIRIRDTDGLLNAHVGISYNINLSKKRSQ